MSIYFIFYLIYIYFLNILIDFIFLQKYDYIVGNIHYVHYFLLNFFFFLFTIQTSALNSPLKRINFVRCNYKSMDCLLQPFLTDLHSRAVLDGGC